MKKILIVIALAIPAWVGVHALKNASLLVIDPVEHAQDAYDNAALILHISKEDYGQKLYEYERAKELMENAKQAVNLSQELLTNMQCKLANTKSTNGEDVSRESLTICGIEVPEQPVVGKPKGGKNPQKNVMTGGGNLSNTWLASLFTTQK